jgi:hypothetical protein
MPEVVDKVSEANKLQQMQDEDASQTIAMDVHK